MSWAFLLRKNKLMLCVGLEPGEQGSWLDRASPLGAGDKLSHGVCELGR